MLASKDISVVVVQGSFQTPLVYKSLVDSLTSCGYETFQPELPSCSNTDNPEFPSKTLADDSKVIQDLLTRLVKNEGKKIAVVMHSYGGLVGSNAIPEELSFPYRKSLNLSGGVIYLFYFCAFILSKNQSVLSAFGESPNNDVKVGRVSPQLI